MCTYIKCVSDFIGHIFSPQKRNKDFSSHRNISCGCLKCLKSGCKMVPVGAFRGRVNEQTRETDTHRQGGGTVGGVVLPGG